MMRDAKAKAESKQEKWRDDKAEEYYQVLKDDAKTRWRTGKVGAAGAARSFWLWFWQEQFKPLLVFLHLTEYEWQKGQRNAGKKTYIVDPATGRLVLKEEYQKARQERLAA